mgnify:CR=1 FL=1|jgi:hypothetical protein
MMNVIGTFAAFVSALIVAVVIGAVAVARTASGWTRIVFPMKKASSS